MLPGEPHLLADGKTVLIHTFSCGLYELDGLATEPTVRHRKTFEGERCAVPLRIGHYWIQTMFTTHALVAYDISDLGNIREVSRVTFDDKQKPHWIATDADGKRIVLNSGEYGEHRLFMLNFDPQSGALFIISKQPDGDSQVLSASAAMLSDHDFERHPHPATSMIRVDRPAYDQVPAGGIVKAIPVSAVAPLLVDANGLLVPGGTTP